jgi:vacuolar protein sorting-associated protein 13A/C
VDLTFSLDNRNSGTTQQLMTIDIMVKPIVLRASYRDINLILAIANRALALSGNSQPEDQPKALLTTDTAASRIDSRAVVKSGKATELATGQARVIMAKEQVRKND